MSEIYISSLTEEMLGEEISGLFLLSEIKEKAIKKDLFIGKLKDKTGSISCTIPKRLFPKEKVSQAVDITGIVSMYHGHLQLDVRTLKGVSADQKKSMEKKLVLGLSDQEAYAQMVKMKQLFELHGKKAEALLMEVYRRERVIAMAECPGTYETGFYYNGGQLDKAVYLLKLVESLQKTELPTGARKRKEIDWDTVFMGVALCCLGETGMITPMPEGAMDPMSGGMKYLPEIIQAIRSSSYATSLLHCLRVHFFSETAQTAEAEIMEGIMKLGCLLASHAYE